MTATLKMISSMATRELLARLAAQFQAAQDWTVQAESAGGVEVARRIGAGENFDVVVLAADAIDKLIAAGSVDAPRIDLVRSGVAVAVRAGAAAPAITTEQEVRAAVQAAPSLSFSTGPSGVYLEQLFERWGILAQVRPRIVVPPPGVPVGSLVADGSVALGFQQLSELMNLPGIRVLGPLPEAIQTLTVFAGGICAGSGAAQGARELLDYLASPQVADIKQQFGMQPA